MYQNKQLPLVSICVPAYNSERFIVETIESALAQTYPNTEIIVSDDASTDHTPEIVARYASRRVHLVAQPQNLGRFGNFNAAIRASCGAYVCKLDADDILAPEYLSEMVEVMEARREVTFAHCACRLIDVNSKPFGYERSIHGSFIRNGLQEWPRYVFGPRAVNIVMIRRSAFDRVGGYDERYKYSGDWAMHRSLLLIGSVFYNDRVLASYRAHNVGKQGIRHLQTQEHLMHLEDMERDWPEQVPGKDRLLRRARGYFAVHAMLDAAHCPLEEMQGILQLIPLYTRSWDVRLLQAFLGRGGAGAIRLYTQTWQRSRLLVKALIFYWRERFRPLTPLESRRRV